MLHLRDSPDKFRQTSPRISQMEMTIDQADEDKQMTSQDVKALVSALQLESSRVLTQIVYAQSH